MSTLKRTRREFLKSAAFTGAAVGFPAIVPSSALGLEGSTAPSNRIVMGISGTGLQGRSNMGKLLGKKDAHIIAVCDVDQKHLLMAKHMTDEKYGNTDCSMYDDFRQMNQRDDIDAVLIATPDHWHVLQALDAVRNGKDVYVQKPMALTIKQGRALADEAKRLNRIVQVGSQQRSDARFRQACELARNGRLGTIHTINVMIPDNNRFCGPAWSPQPVPKELNYDRWLGPAAWAEYHEQRCHYQFRFILDYSGGQVTNWGAHNLDISQWALEADDTGPIEITGNGEFPGSGLFTTATKVHFECIYANGARLVCKTSDSGSKMFIEGSDGTVYVDRKSIRAVEANPAKAGSILEEPVENYETHLYKSDDHFQNFLDCVKSRKQAICNAEVGHRTSSICNLGNIAMILGRKLRWDPKAERFLDDPKADALRGRTLRGEWKLDA